MHSIEYDTQMELTENLITRLTVILEGIRSFWETLELISVYPGRLCVSVVLGSMCRPSDVPYFIRSGHLHVVLLGKYEK